MVVFLFSSTSLMLVKIYISAVMRCDERLGGLKSEFQEPVQFVFVLFFYFCLFTAYAEKVLASED